MASFAWPENAFKRADELINVGQKQEALQVLRDLISSKRCRAWQKPLEKIMFKYIELCVELRKVWFAKDGLIRYRIVCQEVNVTSLEEVIKHFMHLSTERAEVASNQAQALEEALDVDDLETDERPEDLMPCGEKGKAWFKFLWETYRTVLEILRNNSKLETLYALTAHRAFHFCKQYKQTTEFHRLCEIIRNHLANLNKYRDQRDRPDLSSPESLQLYVDTRFEQLKIATELELWQESFRSVEDIHGLMCMVKKTPKPSLMAIYYAKLTAIFRFFGSHLYHAYAWFKLFSLQKSYNKNLSQKDLQLIASSVVLAALSVSPYDHTLGSSQELENKERNLRMANLIGFNLDLKLDSREALSRSSLLSELVSKGVMSCVIQEVEELYNILEHEFLPLDLASKVGPLVAKISKIGGKLSSASSVPEVQLSQYVPSLEKLATLRSLQQVSRVYRTMKIDTLSQMIPYFDFSVVEKISVHAVTHHFILMKIDHMKGAVLFGNMGLESEELRDHLSNLAEKLNGVRAILRPPTKRASKLGDSISSLADKIDKEHRRLVARKSIIEKRKKERERHILETELEEESKWLKLQKITEEAERKRLASEYEQRKNLRILWEIEERELEEAQALLQEAEKRSKKKGRKPIIEGEKVTKQTLMELVLTEELRERQENEKKLQKVFKTVDHLERAKREEAALLNKAAFQQRLVAERVLYEREQQLEIETSRQCHDCDLKVKNRLSCMLGNMGIFLEKAMKMREAECNRSRQEMEDQTAQIIRERKQERDANRKMLFYLRSEEERQMKLHGEEVRKCEEVERQKKEEAEVKLDEISAKQRQRDLELEEKERLRKESLGKTTKLLPKALADVPLVGRPMESVSAAAPGKYVPPRFKRGDGSVVAHVMCKN